jgi:hypothetical protein
MLSGSGGGGGLPAGGLNLSDSGPVTSSATATGGPVGGGSFAVGGGGISTGTLVLIGAGLVALYLFTQRKRS